MQSVRSIRAFCATSVSCLILFACGGAPDETEPSPGSAGRATGGSTSPGPSSGGAISGSVASGGASFGGASSGSGFGGAFSGSSSGGASVGGAGSGGSNVGGPNSGGMTTTMPQGGRASGGSTSGGSGSMLGGRSSLGGASNPLGGASNPLGGTSTAMGGRGSGGASTGGAMGKGGSGTGGTTSGCAATGFHVRGGILYDSKCSEFVLRGVNYPYAWFASRNAQQDLAAIAATGANSVRLTLGSGARWTKTTAANLTTLINAAKAAKLVAVVEVHDTTGYSEQSGSVPLSNATSYWTGSDIATVLKGQEAYVIINIANEPNGNNTSSSWAPSHVTAVGALRSAGFTHTLMVDAPNWGQDWENTMRDGGGASIWTADTQKNLVFSVHMYDVYATSSTVSTYFNTFLMRYEAPLVVGEFAADHGASGNVDESSIMSFAESLGIGYLGWSWAGNSSDLATLNITNNFNASSLTTWGNALINGANGIKATSKPCTCFN